MLSYPFDHLSSPREELLTDEQNYARELVLRNGGRKGHPRFRTDVCRHWQLGKCFFGEKCCFAHGNNELRELKSRDKKDMRMYNSEIGYEGMATGGLPTYASTSIPSYPTIPFDIGEDGAAFSSQPVKPMCSIPYESRDPFTNAKKGYTGLEQNNADLPPSYGDDNLTSMPPPYKSTAQYNTGSNAPPYSNMNPLSATSPVSSNKNYFDKRIDLLNIPIKEDEMLYTPRGLEGEKFHHLVADDMKPLFPHDDGSYSPHYSPRIQPNFNRNGDRGEEIAPFLRKDIPSHIRMEDSYFPNISENVSTEGVSRYHMNGDNGGAISSPIGSHSPMHLHLSQSSSRFLHNTMNGSPNSTMTSACTDSQFLQVKYPMTQTPSHSNSLGVDHSNSTIPTSTTNSNVNCTISIATNAIPYQSYGSVSPVAGPSAHTSPKVIANYSFVTPGNPSSLALPSLPLFITPSMPQLPFSDDTFDKTSPSYRKDSNAALHGTTGIDMRKGTFQDALGVISLNEHSYSNDYGKLFSASSPTSPISPVSAVSYPPLEKHQKLPVTQPISTFRMNEMNAPPPYE